MAHDVRNGNPIVKKWDDWALLDRGSAGWVVAHYPQYDTDGNITSWGHGHYFTDFFDAVNYARIQTTDKNMFFLSALQTELLADALLERGNKIIENFNEISDKLTPQILEDVSASEESIEIKAYKAYADAVSFCVQTLSDLGCFVQAEALDNDYKEVIEQAKNKDDVDI